MKNYKKVIIINTSLFVVFQFVLYLFINAFWSSFAQASYGYNLPPFQKIMYAICNFANTYWEVPLLIWMLWVIGNVFYLRFIFGKNIDNIELLLEHLISINIQCFIYLILMAFYVWALFWPLAQPYVEHGLTK